MVEMVLFLVIAAVLQVIEAGDPQLWRVDASPHHQVLRSLQDEGHLDIWGGTSTHSKVMVETEDMQRVKRALEEAGVKHSVDVEDPLALLESKIVHTRKKRAINLPLGWKRYHDYYDIESFIGLLNLTSKGILREEVATMTLEGRPLRVVRVTDPLSLARKKKIWIEAGIHAREWISPAVTTYLINLLVNDPNWQPLLQVTEWYIVPVANPDGYQHSFSGDARARMWRKNRRNNGDNRRCKGVDLNRNWNLKWGVGASGNPCSDTYKGPTAFSELETQGLQSMMKQIGDIDLFITFHSYGQTVLYPWGWTMRPPANVKMLKRVARKFADAVKRESNGATVYQIGGSGPLYGFASGATDDWAYGVLGVPLSYTIELPDKGQHGFLLPENRIESTARETAAGLYCMASFISNVGSCASRRTRNPSWTFRRQSPLWI